MTTLSKVIRAFCNIGLGIVRNTVKANLATKMCFIAGTAVATATPDGSVGDQNRWPASTPANSPANAQAIHHKPIEQIQPGDIVWAKNEQTGKVSKRKVLQTFITHPDTLYHLALDHDADGTADETITGTHQHPFWEAEQKKWIEMGELKAGNTLHLIAGKATKVLTNSLERAPPTTTFTTYNFEVAEDHTYFVGKQGIWVHNEGTPCDKIYSMFYLQAKRNFGGIASIHKNRFKILEETKASFRGTSDIPTSSWAESVKDVQSSMAKDLKTEKVDLEDLPNVKEIRAFNRRQPSPGTAGNHVHHSVETWIQRDKLGLTQDFDDVPGWLIEGADHTFGPGRPKAGTLAGDLENAIKPIATGKHLEVTTALKQVYENRGLNELWDITKAWLDSKDIPTP